MQLSKIRGAANGKIETSRGRKSPAQEYTGVSPQAAYSDEARAPKFIIQEGKKGIWGLMIIFMEIQPVIEAFRKDIARRNRRVSRYQCWNKLTGKTGVKARVKAESRPVFPEKEQAKLNASRIAEACFRP